MSNRLISPEVVGDKVIIGDFRADIVTDRKAEEVVRKSFPELDVITSVEGNKLIPIVCLLKLNKRIEQENIQTKIVASNETEQAKNDGYKKGYQDGLNKGHEEAQQVIDNFGSLINTATQERRRLYEDAKKNILEMIISIAKKITFGAARTDPDVTAGIISGVIDKIVDKTKIKVKVHPEHYPSIDQQIDRFKADSTAIKDITIEPDTRVRQGGCYIETPSGDIDARVESQMDIITSAFDNSNGEL
ncbi:MAG: hypothetical protein GY865_04260 [candidate division Zixibacteria bacterium]|nr:hypothetical protein [candidate division Zixibacteria bacterium]